jgi:predicted PurR-regulated permease PerM
LTQTANLRAVALVAFAGLVLWAAYLARDVILIVYISTVLAIGLGPLVHSIEHSVPAGVKRVPRWLAVLMIYLVIVGTLTLLALLVVPPLVSQSQDLSQRLPELLDKGQQFLIRYGILEHPITLEEAVRNAPGPGDAVGTVALAVSRVVGGIFAFLTILILTFYLLLESETLFVGFIRFFPRAERPRVENVARQISTKVSAWLNGQLILAGSIGLTAAVGLYLIGVPYFYVLALICALGEMIPVVGPILSAIPALAVALAVSPRTALFAALFLIAQQQLENHVLVPKVMERQVGVSPVIVIVALLVGGSLLGILGALLAVPTAAIVQVVVEELLNERDRLADQHLGPHFD